MAYKNISLSKIDNYFKNPRHDIGVNEEDTLKKLFEKTGFQKMINLAEDIYLNGLVNANLITVVENPDNDRYTVYEGNRRIACLKLIDNPSKFPFLSKNQIDRMKELKKENPSTVDFNNIACLVTDESDAYFIMDRIHSGEDKGRGVKSWESYEKDNFKHRTSPEEKRSISNIIANKYLEYLGEDIKNLMAYTNIQRLFNNREVKSAIGIDINIPSSFSKENILIIKSVIEKVNIIVHEKETSISREFNKSRIIEDILLPIIEELKMGGLGNQMNNEENTSGNNSINSNNEPIVNSDNEPMDNSNNNGVEPNKEEDDSGNNNSSGHDESQSNNNGTNSENKDEPKEIQDEIENDDVKKGKSNKNVLKKLGAENILTDARPYKNLYQKNIRIKNLVWEINKIKYKDFKLSTQFLLRTMMETYGHEYVDYFANLDYTDPKKMRSISKERKSRNQTVNEIYYDFIQIHIKKNFPKFHEQAELINVSLSTNNNSSLMEILNFHIHSQNHIPDTRELLEAWIKIAAIVESIDEILYENDLTSID